MGYRSISTVMAFVLGVPLGIGLVALFHQGPLADTFLARYVSHPVEMVTVVMFGCAVGALLTKLLGLGQEWAAFRREWLPAGKGKPAPVETAGHLLDEVQHRSGVARNTILGRRIVNVLEFVNSRRSANDLDDHLHGLADNDDIALDNSYSLIRFITWAIPILGFLGTVLGITGAISGVTPQVLENNLSTVTDGLALAFDTTAVALALTMVTMFFSFVVERLETNLLDSVNHYADEQLAHRFERSSSADGEIVEVVRRNTQVLLEATEKLVMKQANLWSQSLEEAQKQWLQTGQRQQKQMAQGMEEALNRTLESHQLRLAEQEETSREVSAAVIDELRVVSTEMASNAEQQQTTTAQVLQQLTMQTEVLNQLAASGWQLVKLQDVLQHNLHVLAQSGAFEEAVNSLTAAIHLLTTKVNAGAPAAEYAQSRIAKAA